MQDKIIRKFTGPFVTGPFEVTLTYFKRSGKYYSEGKYTSQKVSLYEIWEEIRDKLHHGDRPGLVDGKNEFYVTVDVPEHPHNHPHLIVPEAAGTGEEG